jgi:hypothetical protein
MTIQLAEPSLAEGSPGHAAVVIGTPDGQTYAGFGPANHDWRSLYGGWSLPRVDLQTAQPGKIPSSFSDPNNYSTVFGHNSFSSFTIPITEDQADKAVTEIARIRSEGANYNIFNANVCTAFVNQIMEAAGLGKGNLPSIFPSENSVYLSNVERALRAASKAGVAFDGAGSANTVPEALRNLQRDYAFVGGGYDTPAERHGSFPTDAQSLPSQRPMFNDRFGNWASRPNEPTSLDQGQPTSTDEVGRKTIRYLSGQIAGPSSESVFDTGASPVPFVPSGSLSPQAPASFDDRFGHWSGPSTGSVPVGPPQTIPLLPSGSVQPTDSQSTRVLSSRTVLPSDANVDKRRFLSSSVPNQALRMTAIAPHQPASNFAFSQIFGLPDPSAPSGDDMSDWFDRWVKPLM